ncbi:MAG: hypothetical protein Q9M43_06720 [Sulfurimonas sp.]|nr:hypothetical protein [Sulfurimonas sp.]
MQKWICTLDVEHLLLEKGLLAKLNKDEIVEVKKEDLQSVIRIELICSILYF